MHAYDLILTLTGGLASGEVALALIEDILDSLGATPERIDRERARAHRDLSGDV
jgi:hypothetical protein